MIGPIGKSQTWKRVALYGLTLLSLGLLTTVSVVLLTEEPMLTEEEAFPEPVILDPEKKPRFVFPVTARTTDLSLNRFVDRFARVCMQGRYSEFRLMLSERRPPMLPPRFESNFNALKRVQVLSIERMPPIPNSESPLYLMRAEYELEEYAAGVKERIRQVEVALAKEDGQWRLGPLPEGAADLLAKYREGPSAAPATPAPSADDSPPAPVPEKKASANRPARLDS